MLGFFDRTMDKDVANIMMYGFEGRHYKLEGGKIILPEETSQLRVQGSESAICFNDRGH